MAIVARRPTHVKEPHDDNFAETIMAVADETATTTTTTTTTSIECVMTSFPTKSVNSSTPNSIVAIEGELPSNQEMSTTSGQQTSQDLAQEQPAPTHPPAPQQQHQQQQAVVTVQPQISGNKSLHLNNTPIPVVSHAPAVTTSTCVRSVIVPTPPSGMFHSPHAGGYITRIRTPHPHDVLCGRGGGINGHPGNRRFRAWVRERKAAYNGASVSKTEKARIARDVVDLVRSLRPPGRFLTREEYSSGGTPAFGGSMLVTGGGFWVEIDTVKALTKTSQALREGAPSIRATTAKAPISSLPQSTSPSHGPVHAAISTTQVVATHLVSAAPVPGQNVVATPVNVLSSPLNPSVPTASIPSTATGSVPSTTWTTPPLVSNRRFASKVASVSSEANSATVSDNDDDDHHRTGDEPPTKRRRHMSTDIVMTSASAPENALGASAVLTVPAASETVEKARSSSISELLPNGSSTLTSESSTSFSEKASVATVGDSAHAAVPSVLPSSVMEELRRITPTTVVVTAPKTSEDAKEVTPVQARNSDVHITNVAEASPDHLEFVNPFDTAEEQAMLQVVAQLLKEKEGNTTSTEQDLSLMSALADFPSLECGDTNMK